jgi:hypothetical protein
MAIRSVVAFVTLAAVTASLGCAGCGSRPSRPPGPPPEYEEPPAITVPDAAAPASDAAQA